MLYGILLFAAVFTVYSIFLQKKMVKKKFVLLPFLKELGTMILGGLLIYAVLGIVIVFLNELAISLMITYFQDNGYTFESLSILNQSLMYFEEPVASEMISLTGFSKLGLLLIFGGRYFLELVFKTISVRKSNQETKNVLMLGFVSVSIRIVLGPIVALISLVFLVILTAVCGVSPWVVIATLVIFRFLSNYFWLKISGWAENLLKEEKVK